MILRRAILAAGAFGLLAANAAAEPVRFENPTGAGHIDWENFWIDMTLSASAQTGNRSDSTLANSVNVDPPEHFPQAIVSSLSMGFSTSIITDPAVGIVPLEFGALIGPGGMIPDGGGTVFFRDTIESNGGPVSSLVFFPLGRSFIGASFRAFDANDDVVTHFGWMEVNLFQRPDGTHKVDALAWGYETEPETAVRAGIPTPGTGAVIALAAGALSIRRRR